MREIPKDFDARAAETTEYWNSSYHLLVWSIWSSTSNREYGGSEVERIIGWIDRHGWREV